MNTKKTAIILSIMALVGTGAVMPTLAADVVFPEMAARVVRPIQKKLCQRRSKKRMMLITTKVS